MIPPEQNAEFVAAMEDILDVYQRPYDASRPVVNMDEHLVQLVKETRIGVATRPDSPERFDYEYERNGTAVNFMFTEPLSGWRKVRVRQRKRARDWAHEIKELLNTDYREAETVVLVCDNLNTHKPAALYKAFPPEEARRLARRLEIHYTPKHGSCLPAAGRAQHCRDRTERLEQSMLEGTHPRYRIPQRTDFRLDERSQQQMPDRRLAVHDRRRSHQTEKAVPGLRRELAVKRYYGDRHITRMEHLSARVFRDVCRGDWSDVRGKLRLGRALRICSKYIIRQELVKMDRKEGGESHGARDG